MKRLSQFIFLFVPLITLMIISLINMKIVSTTNIMYKSYFLKQTLWFSIGFLAIFIFKIIKPKIFFKYSKYLYFFNVLLLILVLFFGKTINGSRAWFDFGFFSFQPSELMKFTLTLYLCEKSSNRYKYKKQEEFKFLLTIFFLTLIPSLFVFLEPDTGAIIIYFLIMLGIIFIYKINFKWYICFTILLISILGSFFYFYYFQQDLLIKLIGTSFFYRVDRILTFVSGDSFQLDRALISIGASSFIGHNNNLYIPEAPTDFIVASSISNLGIWSFLVIILSFLTLDIYFLYKLFKSKDIKNNMFISAFLCMFIFAQIENIGMNIGLLPIIGLPLPFLSYGGTNTIVYFLFLGFMINLEKNVNFLKNTT